MPIQSNWINAAVKSIRLALDRSRSLCYGHEMTMQTDGPVRKVKDGDRARSDLLQAALEEFAKKGFDSATVRGIAARIGMGHSAIRHHYETKEKLWFAAVDFLFERLASDVSLTDEARNALLGGDLSIYQDWLRRYVRYCARHPEHARIMFQESVATSDRLRKVVRKHIVPTHTGAPEIIELMIKAARLPKETPPATMIFLITGACQNLFALAAETKLSLDYDALSDAAIEAHANAIVRLFCPET